MPSLTKAGKVDIVIPAFNEAYRIEPTLLQYLHYFDQSIHFIVVLNGCTDHTADIVSTLAASHPQRLTVITIAEAIGKGAAIRVGWKTSTADIIGFTDADGSTSAAEFDKLLQAIPHYDGVIASRFLPASKILDRFSVLRSLGSTIGSLTARLLFKLPFKDTQCGAKVFKANVIKKLLPTLQENKFAFDIELLWKAYKEGYTIKELPIIWIDQPGSASLGGHGQFIKAAWQTFVAVMRLRLRH
jgi:glycosyltransferase involved in cell wall biosynthesis